MTTGMKFDGGKIDYALVDDDAEAETVAVLTYGAEKYSKGNWSLVDDADARYFAAARRHLRVWRAGEALDGEHGMHHLASAICSLHFLLALELRARPDLVASLPARLTKALEVARQIRAEREAPALDRSSAARSPLKTSVRKKRRDPQR